jgi:hypothetical protein
VRFLSNPNRWTAGMVIVFFILWVATEIAELRGRAQFVAEFKAFHDAGARFTHDDGDAMRAQMDTMQAQVDLLIKIESAEHSELR